MIRTVVTPHEQHIPLHLPPDFIGKKVEVTAFTIEDSFEEPLIADKPLTDIASEKSLGKDWLTNEEDKAWQDL